VAQALQIGKDPARADAALKALIDKQADIAAVQIAETYALRRDPDDMFKWLDRAWLQHDAGLVYLLYDPLILRYRADPRFAGFCRKIGLPVTTDAVAMQ
jgi:serine/threonine-protein kinase